jgi:hypothetical protein
MCGENALKEVIRKVLEKVQVGVGEDWEACKKQSVSGGVVPVYVPAYRLPIKTDNLFVRVGGQVQYHFNTVVE